MRWASKRTRAAALLAASILFVAGRRATACSCTWDTAPPACEQIAKAGVAFTGSVLSLEAGPEGPLYGRSLVYRFSVDTIYKGLPPLTAEVRVHPGFIGCREMFSRRTRYPIFGSRFESGLVWTNLCLASLPVAA